MNLKMVALRQRPIVSTPQLDPVPVTPTITITHEHISKSWVRIAAKMSTMFEPLLSTSTMRAPLSSAVAPSMADSLPNINFGFEELRDRMNKFTVKFDAFIEQGRKRVLEERNQFRMNVAELQGMNTPRTIEDMLITIKRTNA